MCNTIPLALLLATVAVSQDGGIQPRLDEASLHLGEASVTAVRSGPTTWGELVEVRWGLVEATAGEIRRLDPETGEVLWSVSVALEDRILVGDTDDALIIAGELRQDPPPLEIAAADGTLRPFGEDFLGHGLEETDASEVLLAVTGRAGWRYVLSRVYRKAAMLERLDATTAHRLRAYDQKGELAWERRYAGEGDRAQPGAALWAARRPFYASDSLQALTWLGGALLVCPGPLDPLILVGPATGVERSRMERVWEIRRGFIGPSVWDHYLARFDLEAPIFRDEGEQPSQEETGKIEDRRKVEERLWSSALVAGPAVVGDRVFVVVSRAPRGQWEGFLGDPVVYELNENLSPVSRNVLPAMPIGSLRHVDAEGVVWATNNMGLVRLEPGELPEISMGPGGTDALSRVSWTRRVKPPRPTAWLVADPCTRHVRFTATHAFLFPSGGWVPAREGPYHFPLSMVDLVSGAERRLTVTVPFSGKLSEPDSNYSSRGDEYEKYGWYVLGLGQVRVHGGMLRVMLMHDELAYAVDFDLAALLAEAGEK